MKKKSHSYLPILLICFLYSCEKTVYFDVETQPDKLVLNSFVGPESGAEADISLSIDPLDDTYPEYITGATITLYKNDVFVSDFTLSDSTLKYFIDKSLTTAVAGDIYKITASVPGKENVSATCVVPQKIEIEQAIIIDTVKLLTYYTYYDIYGNEISIYDSISFYEVEIQFNDPPDDNYYSLQIMYQDATSSLPVCYTTNDPVYTIGDEFAFSSSSEESLYTVCDDSYFSDITFNGTNKSFRFYLSYIEGIFFDDPKYIINLRHVSEEYYKYYSSVNLQLITQGDPFAQPTVIFSNIDGGFGIFAAFNESIAEVEL